MKCENEKPRPTTKQNAPEKPDTVTIGPSSNASKPVSTAPATGGSVFNRPGVSDQFLTAAGCHHVGSDECVLLYGVRAEGIAIPFRHANGSPIIVNGLPFARVRLYAPTDSQKYTQRKESGSHIYVSPTFVQSSKGSRLFLVEGEFKALALAEAGYAALGLCGFTGAARSLSGTDGERIHELHDELAGLLKMHQSAEVVFLGDSDVVLKCAVRRRIGQAQTAFVRVETVPIRAEIHRRQAAVGRSQRRRRSAGRKRRRLRAVL